MRDKVGRPLNNMIKQSFLSPTIPSHSHYVRSLIFTLEGWSGHEELLF